MSSQYNEFLCVWEFVQRDEGNAKHSYFAYIGNSWQTCVDDRHKIASVITLLLARPNNWKAKNNVVRSYWVLICEVKLI